MTGLVLVNRLPGSGTSTLARDLAAALGLPLFSTDACKESLWAGARVPGADVPALCRRLGTLQDSQPEPGRRPL